MTKDILGAKNLDTRIQIIVNILTSSDLSNYSTNNLLGDKTGISLFMFYYYQLSKKEQHFDFAFDILEKVANTQRKYEIIPTSISKFGWLLLHLNQKELVESDIEELLGNIDHVLFENMIKSIQIGNYDFFHGALGMALYFLNKESGNKKTDNYLFEFINELDKISEKNSDNSIKWISVIDYKKKTKVYNISMSHGIASIIAILSKIYNRGINKLKTKYLLEGAVNYLLQQKLPIGQFNSLFPNLALESMDKLYSSRLAWCYGDLGISVALWHASQALEKKDWEQEAINILLHSAKRRDLKQNGVIDAGFCHGTAGIAHIFNRMYGYTKIEELKKASAYWFDQTLKMAHFGDGLAGYKSWQGEQKGWVNEPGLLEGIAGIGLVMISAVSDIEPTWDECLLLS